MNVTDAPLALLPIDPAVAWSIMPGAAIAFLMGAICVVAPGLVIRLNVRMLEWQRRVFGNFTVDWHLRLLRSRLAPWIVRLMGLFFLLAGIYLFASVVVALSAQPAAQP